MAAIQHGNTEAKMNLETLAPAGVVGVAYIVTELFRKFPNSVFVERFIWLPSALVGVIGAVLLSWGKPWNVIAWDAIQYAAVAPFLVLVIKRTTTRGGNA